MGKADSAIRASHRHKRPSPARCRRVQDVGTRVFGTDGAREAFVVEFRSTFFLPGSASGSPKVVETHFVCRFRDQLASTSAPSNSSHDDVDPMQVDSRAALKGSHSRSAKARVVDPARRASRSPHSRSFQGCCHSCGISGIGARSVGDRRRVQELRRRSWATSSTGATPRRASPGPARHEGKSTSCDNDMGHKEPEAEAGSADICAVSEGAAPSWRTQDALGGSPTIIYDAGAAARVVLDNLRSKLIPDNMSRRLKTASGEVVKGQSHAEVVGKSEGGSDACLKG